MSFNLKAAMEAAAATDAVDFATARKSLPIVWLLETHGTLGIQVMAEKVAAFCPFHPNSDTPAFSVFGPGLQRWSCFAGCTTLGGESTGDAIDLLLKFEPDLATYDDKGKIKYTAPLFRRIKDLITAVIDSGWTGPEGTTESVPFDIEQATEIVESSQVDPSIARIDEFVQYKRSQRGPDAWPYDADFLATEFKVGTYGSWVIIPYYGADGTFTSYKRWTDPTRPRMAPKHSSWSGRLYNEWREDRGQPILLCEGESDVWYAQSQLGDEYRVLGLPTGVNSDISPADRMVDRIVYIAFDGDGDLETKGRGATRRWAERLEEVGADVKIVPVPEGKDLSTAGGLRLLLDQARPMLPPPVEIKAAGSNYVRTGGKNGPRTLSNWIFVPDRGLHGDGTVAFEGKLKPGGDRALLRSEDLASDNKAQAWAAKYGRAWFGSSTDARALLSLIQAQSVFLPAGRLVSVAGLHGDTFVWPGGKIGPEPLVYVPPPMNANLEHKLNIKPGPWDTGLIHLMRAIQRKEVTDPMLAWLAAAPLRVMYQDKSFPFVAVTGARGDGKTQTTQALMAAFSGSYIETTFKSTAHALTSAVSAVNAFPEDWEEYRPGGSSATLHHGEQLFREMYNMQASQKGGMGNNWAALTEIIPSAPVIVTGEDMLSEGSHVERLIPIAMDSAYQNRTAFEKLRSLGATGFPHAYLTWLQSMISSGAIKAPLPVRPTGPDDLASRQRFNLGVIYYGWDLLQAFMSEHNDDLGTPQFDLVIKALQKSNKTQPIEEAIRWCLGEADAGMFVQYRNGEVWVQVDSFYTYISDPRRAVLFTLPGKPIVIRDYIVNKLGGDLRVENRREFHVFPHSKLA